MNQAVIYKGPWKQVMDDDGHILYRGERMAVCDKTYHIYNNINGPYYQDILGILPHETISLESAPEFDCRRNAIRKPEETKGEHYHVTITNSDDSCCAPASSSCC